MPTNFTLLYKRLAALQSRARADKERMNNLVAVVVPYKDDELVEPSDNPKLEERGRGLIVVFYRLEDESEREEMDAKIETLIDEYQRTHTQGR